MAVKAKILVSVAEKREFPVLKQSKRARFVVLFTSESEGTVVANPQNHKDVEIGEHKSGWTSIGFGDVWQDFTDEVILRNE